MSTNSSLHPNTSDLRLRPHHLLCLQTFVGRGYSEEFVEHMAVVKRQLTEIPNTLITLVRGADDLCAHCPNCVEGQCTSENPALFDRLVEEKLARLDSSSNLPPVLNGIPDRLYITDDTLSECCPGCEWTELCTEVYLHTIMSVPLQ